MLRFVATLSALLLMLHSATARADAQSVASGELHIYVREGCPHCAAAKVYLPTLQQQYPALTIHIHDVEKDPAARERLTTLSRAAGVWPPGVPSFVFNGGVLVGFDADDTHELHALLAKRAVAADTITLPLLGAISVTQLGLPTFTLLVGLLDGFNPCAMWVLLFLLSLLVHLRNRLRMALIAGTFVLVSGAVYFAFMAAWLNVFLAVGLSTWLRLVLAALAIVIGAINVNEFRRRQAAFTLSIPARAKPGIYARMRRIVNARSLPLALLSAAVLAVIVNVIELLCTAGFPALYTAILVQQQLSTSAHHAYLALYIAGYIADDSLMVGTAVLALSSNKLTEQAGRWLKLISGAVMLLLGVVMLLKPQWLM
ncbi:MAG: NrdH-redoxin [Proteobacteria bacterium]|nr:NrdH-redoxin [Pseudomonadota bacterium]